MVYDKVIELRGSITFDSYLHVLEELLRPSSGKQVLIDLSQIHFAHASGMTPLVALISDICDQEWSIDVALPENDFLYDYFRKAGWLQGITGAQSDGSSSIPGSSYVPLTKYDTEAELNPLIADIVGHFSREEVFGTGVLEAIEWSLSEVADNVLTHAGGAKGWIQLIAQPKKHLMEVVVADCGRGITSSLKEGYPEIADDGDALQRAVEKGVTRNQKVGQGNGLAGTLRIAIGAHGWAKVHSGSALLSYSPPPESQRSHLRVGQRMPGGISNGLMVRQVPYHQGTVVLLSLPTSSQLDVANALWGNRPSSALEQEHLLEGGYHAVLKLKTEASGFGNRPSARPIRRRLQNLLNMYEDSKILVDFEGVHVVSASFADEFIARLVKEIGVATFFQRVGLQNMNELTRRTVDEVLQQRLSS
ncbi:MAG TPA: DUF4325 domain-containing protein [Acidimicrobiales bacterium]|nr:DUF4325 domain-containing protein [Acidimicrobiales bacterium]